MLLMQLYSPRPRNGPRCVPRACRAEVSVSLIFFASRTGAYLHNECAEFGAGAGEEVG